MLNPKIFLESLLQMLNQKNFVESLLSKTNEYLIKYKLRRKLLLLEKPFSTFTDNLMFPNPVKG
jgi:hypothetical protein